jgi:hypothetical protein
MSAFRTRNTRRSPITRATRSTPRPKSRLELEALEERLVLNNRFVVPVGVPVDNVTNFGSLAAALSTPGLSKGDVIQIEAGATPGNVTAADLTAPGVANLTIQGDPTAALASIPQFTISDATTIGAAETGLTFKNVNVGLIDAGKLEFDSSTTITSSSIVDINSSAAVAIFFNPGGVANVTNSVTNSTLADASGALGVILVEVVPSPGAGCSNLFTGDQFVAADTTGSGVALLEYFNAGNATVNTSSDLVANNTFTAQSGSKFHTLFWNNATVSVLSVTGNTFSSPDANTIAMDLDNSGNSQTQITNVLGNTIHLTGVNSVGIQVTGGFTGGATILADIFNNQISTNGTGLLINASHNTTNKVDVQAQGNDFHANQIGVEVVTTTLTAPANLLVNLGDDPVSGGFLPSSIGGNDFRGFGPASATGGAIVVTGTDPSALIKITAKNDIFGNSPPVAYVGVNNVGVDKTGILSPNAAFVETLYQTLLKRTGDTSSAADAGGWVSLLDKGTLTQAAVAQAISHSPEALGLVVDGLYLKVLGRTADAAGRAAFVNLLANGGTLEQATAALMSSPEYVGMAGSDAGFVQSLYSKLLGRMGSSADVAAWVQALHGAGRAAVINGFLSSAEYRGDVVQQLYGFTLAPPVSEASLFNPVLHRTAAPMPGEVSGWVNSPLDILAIETAMVGSGEFYSNG